MMARVRGVMAASTASRSMLRVRGSTSTNTGTAPDRLVGTSMELAAKGEVHEMATENGVMKMRPVDGIAIAPGASIELKPGGFHLMFMGLKGGLKQGQAVKGTLVFEKAGTVDVTFDVGAMGARSSGGGGHSHH